MFNFELIDKKTNNCNNLFFIKKNIILSSYFFKAILLFEFIFLKLAIVKVNTFIILIFIINSFILINKARLI